MFFTLFGDFEVSPGERHFAIVLSRLKEEASKGIAIIDRWLSLLKVPHRLAGDVIELDKMPRGLRVVAASVAASSGWRAFFVAKDERSKWAASNVEDREAEEVDTSAAAMTATHPLAPQLSFGSAWGRFGTFYNSVKGGSDEFRIVLGPAPTWVAAPHISEEALRKKERNASKFDREYRCVFQEAGEEALLSLVLIDRAIRPGGWLKKEKGVTYVAAMDPAFARNAWTFVIAGKRLVDNRVKRSIIVNKEWRGTTQEPLDPAVILKEISGICKEFGVTELYTDQYESFSLRSIANRPDIALDVHVGSRGAVERLGRYEALATQFADGEIELPNDRMLRADLIAVKQKLTPTGFTIYLPETPDGRHSDYAPSVTLALSKCTVEPEMPPPILTEREAEDARVMAEIMAMEKATKRQGDPLVRRIGRVGR